MTTRPGGSVRTIAAGLLAGALVLVACAGGDEATSPGRLDDCVPESTGQSVPRQWNEASLAAIRSDFPAPTVHARNLFHLSAGMWDAWAAYDDGATAVFLEESRGDDLDDDEVRAAREEAMSFAAYRLLVHRYLASPEAETAVTRLDELLASWCYDADYTEVDGDSPAAFGNRIAATIIDHGLSDGSNEVDGYVDPDYQPTNAPLIVDRPGTEMIDPNRWQPLELEEMVAQNGLPLDETTQEFVGPHWGWVTSFALPDPDPDGVVIDVGPPPHLDADSADAAIDVEFLRDVTEVIEYSALLDPAASETIDISPAVRGNRELGRYEDVGHDVNPVTGEPYEPNLVRHADYGRVVAEFWADGPDSETPPGHWNSIANEVSDELEATGGLRIGGEGDEVDRLEWDTKLYLALNGAAHDAAVAAWGLKGHYDYVRPISMIRYLGQSGDLDVVPGLVEPITAESSAPGGRHEHLADHVGESAVWAWLGPPDDPEEESGAVGWARAATWVPYQQPTFVTPAFAGYVSGHSTFSRAAAEVLTSMTGSEYFPGGLGEWRIPAGSLEFEAGPDEDVVLQWATYADAADEAGRSRLYGGIHVRADDLDGRIVGAQVGTRAWEAATELFGGAGDE